MTPTRPDRAEVTAGRVTASRVSRHWSRREQWTLPTPCTEWDATALVEHVIGFHDFLLLRPLGVRAHRPRTDPAARWEATAAVLFAALDVDGVLDRATELPGGGQSSPRQMIRRAHDRRAGAHLGPGASDRPARRSRRRPLHARTRGASRGRPPAGRHGRTGSPGGRRRFPRRRARRLLRPRSVVAGTPDRVMLTGTPEVGP